MIKRRLLNSVIVLSVTFIILLGAYVHNIYNATILSDIIGSYKYEKEGFGGDFIINLNKDGTFTYSEGLLSSHIGVGSWTLLDKYLVMTENDIGNTHPRINNFIVENNNLVYQIGESSGFTNIKLSQGEKFVKFDI